jgi:hypothetical protein
MLTATSYSYIAIAGTSVDGRRGAHASSWCRMCVKHGRLSGSASQQLRISSARRPGQFAGTSSLLPAMHT